MAIETSVQQPDHKTSENKKVILGYTMKDGTQSLYTLDDIRQTIEQGEFSDSGKYMMMWICSANSCILDIIKDHTDVDWVYVQNIIQPWIANVKVKAVMGVLKDKFMNKVTGSDIEAEWENIKKDPLLLRSLLSVRMLVSKLTKPQLNDIKTVQNANFETKLQKVKSFAPSVITSIEKLFEIYKIPAETLEAMYKTFKKGDLFILETQDGPISVFFEDVSDSSRPDPSAFAKIQSIVASKKVKDYLMSIIDKLVDENKIYVGEELGAVDPKVLKSTLSTYLSTILIGEKAQESEE